MKNTSKATTNSLAAGNLYQARMGPNSVKQTPETHNLNAQMSSNYFEKKRRCSTMVNMNPSNYLETCSWHLFLFWLAIVWSDMDLWTVRWVYWPWTIHRGISHTGLSSWSWELAWNKHLQLNLCSTLWHLLGHLNIPPQKPLKILCYTTGKLILEQLMVTEDLVIFLLCSIIYFGLATCVLKAGAGVKMFQMLDNKMWPRWESTNKKNN